MEEGSERVLREDGSCGRMQKSLGEICLKFLNKFGAKTHDKIVNLEYCV